WTARCAHCPTRWRRRAAAPKAPRPLWGRSAGPGAAASAHRSGTRRAVRSDCRRRPTAPATMRQSETLCDQEGCGSFGLVSLAAVAEQKLGGLAIELVGEGVEASHQPAHVADQIGELRQAIAIDEGVGVVG